MNRINQGILITSVLAVLVFAPLGAGHVFAVPDNVPDVAKIKAPPFQARIIETDNLRAVAIPHYTTVDLPDNHETAAGGTLDGVGMLVLQRSDVSGGSVGCSGALLSTGMHVLTAAHCVTDSFGNIVLTGGSVTFNGDSGDETIPLDTSAVAVPKKWNGDFLRGNDIAVIKLESAASADITRYDIDRNQNDDVGAIVGKAGFGISGQGNTGHDSSSYPFGTKRDGLNKYDDVADTMYNALNIRPYEKESILQYDFDNGNSANDAFGFFFGNHDLGEGINEVSSAPGDSGGPSLQNNVITGVTSYGITLTFNDGSTSDVTPGKVDSSFGEFSGDTRVSKYADFVDSVIGSGGGSDDDDGGSGGPSCPPGKQKRGLC